MIDKEKLQAIKEEIERRIKEQQKWIDAEYGGHEEWIKQELVELLNFINSLPEEHNEDLEEEIDEEINNLCELGCYMEDLAKGNFEGVYPLPDNVVKELRKFALHFAEWQKQKDMQDFLEKAEKFFNEELFTRFNGAEYRVASNKCINLQQFIEQFKNYMQNEM